MKKLFFVLSLFTLLFTACNKEENLGGPQNINKPQNASKHDRLYMIKKIPSTKAVAISDKVWEPGSTIRLNF